MHTVCIHTVCRTPGLYTCMYTGLVFGWGPHGLWKHATRERGVCVTPHKSSVGAVIGWKVENHWCRCFRGQNASHSPGKKLVQVRVSDVEMWTHCWRQSYTQIQVAIFGRHQQATCQRFPKFSLRKSCRRKLGSMWHLRVRLWSNICHVKNV